MVELEPGGISAAAVVRVVRGGEEVRLGAAARSAMARSRAIVDRLAASEQPVYGVSTGFGAMATRYVEPDARRLLQASVVRSHAAGMGPPVEREVVRALMLLRARTLAMGHSGVRPLVCERICGLLNADLLPDVPEFGSLGCSGDLAPLSHVALALIGEADLVAADGTRSRIAEPVVLQEKEGLALINGTDGMLGMLVLACADLRRLVASADITAALSIEALLGTDQAFRPELVGLRPHPGQRASAANLSRLLAGSAIVASHREGDVRVQDAYSLRCAPQVHGGVLDAIAFAEVVCERELASAIDNPVVLDDETVASNGNFHGAPLAYAADFLAIPVADLASIAERRTDRLLDPARSHGLPPFLADDPGIDSGLMIAQYTQAAVVSELKRLAVPASVDSIPSSAMQEDHVSMGWGACRKLRRSVDGLAKVLAVELLAGARGVRLRAPLEPAAGTAAACALVPGPGPDRPLADELAAAERVVASGALLAAVEAVTGLLDG